MSVQTRDLYCVDCGETVWGVACEYRKYPGCANCGGFLKISWEGGQAPATDVYGCSQYSDASGQWHSSQREKVKFMKTAGSQINNARVSGFEEAGDKVGGAREETFIRRSYFHSGEHTRKTASEGN